MTSLIAAALFFVLLHLLVSGTRVRDGLIARSARGRTWAFRRWPRSPAWAGSGFAFATGAASLERRLLGPDADHPPRSRSACNCSPCC
jgi:hypothetical protein